MTISKKTKNTIKQYLIILAALFVAYLAIWLQTYCEVNLPQERPIWSLGVETTQTPIAEANDAVVGKQVAKDGILMTVTGFSSEECHTTWCKANLGKDRGNKVALNAKYGKIKTVYIPVYDKEYEVIGTTDQNTDLDIWFGDDGQLAREQGRKELMVIMK